jgi:CDP-glucose 4,6-dehydratase
VNTIGGTRRPMVDGWRGRRVLVTGSTGFKGGWLALWLTELGADVAGLALPPDHRDGVFLRSGLHARIENHAVDLRDQTAVAAVVAKVAPEAVFHLGAQALVPRGYRDPVGTFAVNVVGTASLLAACSSCPTVTAIVVATSDKVYAHHRGNGIARAFVESDRLGGGDPYSASKAATEMVVQCWRESLFTSGHPRVVTARAGNVIGGGDQAEGRLLPDIYRALVADEPVALRHPDAIRPWQFVLEPLAGYLSYASRLLDGDADFPTTLNFGPRPAPGGRPSPGKAPGSDVVGTDTVGGIAQAVIDAWGSGSWEPTGARPGPEAHELVLDASLADRTLGWRPHLDLAAALEWTTEWYRCAADGGDCEKLCLDQIERYQSMVER